MTGSPFRRLLPVPALALALGLVGILAPADAAGPPLSSGCTTLHGAEAATFTSSSGHIFLSDSFTAGEQVRFTVTGTGPAVGVSAPGGSSTLPATSGQPVRYDVSSTGGHTFHAFTSSGSVTLKVACGIPPTITGTDNKQYSVNDAATSDAACVAGTNAIDTCAVGSVDTSSAGSRSYVATATDTAGLRSTRTFHYTVAKKAQTIHFTSAPVTGAKVNDRYGWAVTAESSSGLPVTLSTDEGSPVCQVSPFPPFIYGNVSAYHAGTCNVYANQAGNDEYLPAAQVSTSFEVARESTTMTAAKASKGVLGLSGTTFSASLHYIGWFGPGYGAEFAYPGQTVKFYVGGKLTCSAVTVQKDDGTFFGGGVATCKAPIGVQAALKYNSYTAVYAGSADYLPVTAVGKLQ